jgi:hypothetical protein
MFTTGPPPWRAGPCSHTARAGRACPCSHTALAGRADPYSHTAIASRAGPYSLQGLCRVWGEKERDSEEERVNKAYQESRHGEQGERFGGGARGRWGSGEAARYLAAKGEARGRPWRVRRGSWQAGEGLRRRFDSFADNLFAK